MLLVGAGTQAAYQLQCHLRYFNLKQVWVWAPKLTEAKKFCRQFKALKLVIQPTENLKLAAWSSDIICTCTPSRKPILKRSWIQAGTHINAIGADAKGKQELEPAILKDARIVVDDWEQASHSGEINVPYSRGSIQKRHIIGSLSDVLL